MREFLKMDTSAEVTDEVVLDYFVSGVWWAKEQSFTTEQTSAFFTVLHLMMDNIKGRLKTFHLPYIMYMDIM